MPSPGQPDIRLMLHCDRRSSNVLLSGEVIRVASLVSSLKAVDEGSAELCPPGPAWHASAAVGRCSMRAIDSVSGGVGHGPPRGREDASESSTTLTLAGSGS